jgi:Protein of unknown function (DUF3352)
VRDLLSDVASAVGRVVGRAWGSLSIPARRWVVALAVVAVAVFAFVTVAVPALPCELPGGDRCPPTDDAAQIVPADSLAYLHVNLDPDTEQYQAATDLAAQVPLFAAQIATRATALLPGPGGASPDFERDIAPWFGGELALAVVPSERRDGDSVTAIEIEDERGAGEFAAALAAGEPVTEDYRGFEVSVDERGLASAEIGGFLVIGTETAVRAVIDTGSGASGAPAIAADPTADEVRGALPDHRLADAYVSSKGAARLVADSDGALAALTPLVAPGSTRGAAAAVSVSADALEVSIESALDPKRERASPSFFAAFPRFEPELPERLGADTLAYLGLGAPGETVRALLAQAAAQAPGVAEEFADLVERFRERGDVDIESELLPALGDEAAVAVEPRDDEAGGIPYLQFIARNVDEQRAREALAALQGPLADVADPGGDLQAPVFDEQVVDGVQVHSLRISPTIEVAYAVFDGLAVIATDPAGVTEVIAGDGGLDDAGPYRQATDDLGSEPSLIAFFNLRRLIAAGYAIGLAQVPAFNTFAEDFRHLDSLALEVRASAEGLATNARLVLSEPEPADESATTPPPTD